jgi:hypothetical protein
MPVLTSAERGHVRVACIRPLRLVLFSCSTSHTATVLHQAIVPSTQLRRQLELCRWQAIRIDPRPVVVWEPLQRGLAEYYCIAQDEPACKQTRRRSRVPPLDLLR